MQRRDFLTKAAVGATVVGLAACGKKEEPKAAAPAPVPAPAPAPAPALTTAPVVTGAPAVKGSLPEVKWRLTSSFPKSLDTIYGGADVLANRLRAMTGGKFDIRVFPGGEIVPGLQALDAVQQGTVEVCHTCSYYYVGKDKTFGFGTSIPFGMNARQINAWIYYGGGQKLLDEFYSNYNILSFAGGNTGVQMGGWFRNEIKSLADVKGLKIRIAGLGGNVFSALGAVPQQIAGGDIYPALEKGTIDGAEWVGPYDDEKLGFYKVAKNYYYPGWWEPGPVIHFFVNKKEWEKLPKEYQEAFQAAAYEANVTMMAEYDHKNPAALSKLLQAGVKLQSYPKEVLEAAHKAAQELYADESGKNPAFKKIFTEYDKYRKTQNAWFSLAENRMDTFSQSHK